MSSRARRARLGAAGLLAFGVSVVIAAPADAHTCAKVSVWIAGTERPIGSCHASPGDPGDLCIPLAITPAGTGVSLVVCLDLP